MASWRSSQGEMPLLSAYTASSAEKEPQPLGRWRKGWERCREVKWLGKWKSPWPFRPFRTPPFQHPRPPPSHSLLLAQKPPPCKSDRDGLATGCFKLGPLFCLDGENLDPGNATNTDHTARFPGQESPPPALGPASAPAPRLGPWLNNFRSQCPCPVSPSPAPSFCDSTISIPYLRVAIHLHLHTS